MSLRHRLALIVAAWVLVAAYLVPASSKAEPATKLYVGHAARLTSQIPRDWHVDPTGTYDYVGARGFVASEPISGQSLVEACATEAASTRFSVVATVSVAAWSGEVACHIDGQRKGTAVAVLVVPHPYAFEIWGERYSYAALIADPFNLPVLAAALSFSPDLVTPKAYVSSLIDIVEARAFWADEVDWTLARQEALEAVDGLSTIELAQGAILAVIQKLRNAGDNHSYVLPASPTNPLSEGLGFGLWVGGRQILIVYPDGPAYRAGVRAGDIIEAVDGRPFMPTAYPTDPTYLWALSPQLTLRRPGVTEPFTLTVTQGPYNRYLPPTGRRVSGGIGFLNMYAFTAYGKETDYAVAARRVIATVDQAPTCGWVIDLRLNTGGSYSPMVTGVGPILGNGRFVGWMWADGRQSWVTYQDGRISDDGQEVSDYLPGETDELQTSDPPVAVLIGPMTASSGEVTAMAFVGRPETRFFGEPTSGRTTAILGYSLIDGTILGLAEAAMIDRTGAAHLTGVQPDEFVSIDWTAYGTKQDPVLNAAIKWLIQQPACASAASFVPR